MTTKSIERELGEITTTLVEIKEDVKEIKANTNNNEDRVVVLEKKMWGVGIVLAGLSSPAWATPIIKFLF